MNFRKQIVVACATSLLVPLAVLAADAPAAAAAAAKEAARKEVEAKKASALCEAVTGTRIRPAKDDNCRASVSPFRSYTAEDLQQTGKIGLAEALRDLDPIFR